MARIARIVAVGAPHHITQRGNRRQRVFFNDADYRLYLELLEEWSGKAGLAVWAYCLMPNHVHIVAVPAAEKALHLALKETHRRYSCHVNLREGWRGYLWQGRFSSFPMDERYTFHALRYVEANPVRAGLANRPEDWPWSSAAVSATGADSPPLLAPLPADYHTCPPAPPPDNLPDKLRQNERTGRPLGNDAFIDKLEQVCQRPLRPQKRGRKAKALIEMTLTAKGDDSCLQHPQQLPRP